MQEFTKQVITEARFKVETPKDQVLNLLTAAYKAEVEMRDHKFILTEATLKALNALTNAMTAEKPRFGVMLTGTLGNGKTTLMYAFKRVVKLLGDMGKLVNLDTERCKFDYKMSIVDVKEIIKASKKSPEKYEKMCTQQLLGIDDLGKEPTLVNDYGSLETPVVDLLEYRYNRQLFTFTTTNLLARKQNEDDVTIRDKYGNRMADRFNEMFNVIIFADGSFRN